MGIGAGVFLIAIGAILTFAVEAEPIGGISLDAVGIILMLAGIIGIALDLLIFAPRRRGVRDVAPVDPAYGSTSRTVVERERY